MTSVTQQIQLKRGTLVSWLVNINIVSVLKFDFPVFFGWGDGGEAFPLWGVWDLQCS